VAIQIGDVRGLDGGDPESGEDVGLMPTSA